MGRPRRASISSEQRATHRPSQTATQSPPGVLILTLARTPLYVTPVAHSLLVQLNGSSAVSSSGFFIPPAVKSVCDELQLHLQQHPSRADWDQVQVRHLTQTDQGAILLRGFGVREQGKPELGRLLILLEGTRAEPPMPVTAGEPDYRFTERQQAIVDGLMRGLTNKEIAAHVQISIHTVKEYIRQIMMKLHTTSRTGIVARVAGLTPSAHPTPGGRRTESSSRTIQVA